MSRRGKNDHSELELHREQHTRKDQAMSSLVPMSSLPSNSLFYPGETSGAASNPVFRDDPDGHSDVVLFHGSVSLESLLVHVRSLEHKVCRDDMRGHPS